MVGERQTYRKNPYICAHAGDVWRHAKDVPNVRFLQKPLLFGQNCMKIRK